MTLTEKFWNIIKKQQTDRPAECEELADDFAIGFAGWCQYRCVQKEDLKSQLLIYKKGKGLI
jgi:hypothetical protein